ncbi:MAG TPA: pantoate--beta-alanine ligase [Dehalococcoidia bacterium]|nr:pantoate--beta-alanine ligase [Dehalococcoidia bacterium]
MIVEPSIEGVRRWRHEAGGSVGLVPTMGFLHAGHMSLVERARAENDRVAVSIFVNPAQFGPREDLSTYPRDMERDLTMLREAGVDLVFTPDAAAIYPPGFDTWVEPGAIATRLEGASRPGHFRGVCTVVLKLFTIVQPERAYFGQKDAQQLRVIQRMVADLNLPVAIVPLPIVREPDGLAMSSRNSYLSPAERQAALVLARGMRAAEACWRAGERDGGLLRKAALDIIEQEPLAQVDYVSLADGGTLEELAQAMPGALLSLAVRIGKTRLIDNVVLE